MSQLSSLFFNMIKDKRRSKNDNEEAKREYLFVILVYSSSERLTQVFIMNFDYSNQSPESSYEVKTILLWNLF